MVTTPIRTALGEDGYDNLTSLQQVLVDFADTMHQRLKEFDAPDDAEELVQNNLNTDMNNIARLLSNVRQLAQASDNEIYNGNAAADTANLAFIMDLAHNQKFVS